MKIDNDSEPFILNAFRYSSKINMYVLSAIFFLLAIITSIYLIKSFFGQVLKSMIILIPYYSFLMVLFYNWLKYSEQYDTIVMSIVKWKDENILGIVSGRNVPTYSFKVNIADFKIVVKQKKILGIKINIYDLVFLQEEISQSRCLNQKPLAIKNYIVKRSYFKKDKIEEQFNVIQDYFSSFSLTL